VAAASTGGLPEDSTFDDAVNRVLMAIETSGTVEPRYTALTFEELGRDE
jgi:hypothetical protein